MVKPGGMKWIKKALSRIMATTEGRLSMSKLELTYEQIQKIQEFKADGSIDVEGAQYVDIIEQFAGDMVMVPGGVMHLVTNVQPCIKVAWDYFKMENVVNYELARELVVKHLRQRGVALSTNPPIPCTIRGSL